MRKNDDEIVWLEPNKGSHYHRKGCWMIGKPSYISMPLSEAKAFKGKGWYKPCTCVGKQTFKKEGCR